MLSDNETMVDISNLVEKIIDKSNDTECNVSGIAESFFYYIELLERAIKGLKELRADSIKSKEDLKYIDEVLLPSLMERIARQYGFKYA